MHPATALPFYLLSPLIMNTKKPPEASPRRTLRRSFVSLLATAAALSCASPLSAADWYLRQNQPVDNSWETFGDWNSAANGTGTNATAISSADNYNSNGLVLRTPLRDGPVTFGGALLRLTGGTSTLRLKTTASGVIIPKFESTGGIIENAGSDTYYLQAVNFNNVSGSTAIASATGRNVKLTIGTLVGSGELRVASPGSIGIFAITDATGFLGQIRASGGTLDFDAPLSSSGPLVVDSGALVNLDQSVTVTGLIINGSTFAAGTYTYDTLHTSPQTSAIFTTGTSGGSITVKPPTTWYLTPMDQVNPNHWETKNQWNSVANGTGSIPTEFRSADTFDTNGKNALRTPFVETDADNNTFSGGQVRITTSNTTLMLKTATSAVTPVLPSLFTTDGKINQNYNALITFRIGTWENASMGAFGTTINTLPNNPAAALKISIGKLFGAGMTRFAASNPGSTFYLSIDDAGAYSGTIMHALGRLNFDNNLSSSGPLVINAGTVVELDQQVTFAGLTINGIVKSVGTYSLATLQSSHPGVFTGIASGSITVRPPANWYLSISQGAGDWNTLANWNFAADGSGATATSINSYDNYVNQVASRILLTPATTTTFGGGALVLSSSSILQLRAPAGQVTTIPALDTSGTPTITNGSTQATQSLVVTDWNIGAGTTSLAVPSTETLSVTVDELSGTGTLQSRTVGNYRYAIRDANKFTGTIRHYSGVLTLDRQLGTNGGLIVEAGAQLILNKPGFFTSIKLGTTFLPVGKYTYTWLRTNYGAYFPAGGDANAFLTVFTADTTGPGQMFGVNLAGADSTGGSTTPFPGLYGNQWIYPTAAEFDYYHAKGLNLIRIPFRWERMQLIRGGSLDTAELGRMSAAIAMAKARGMKVILDMHNYARWRPAGINTTPILIGTGGVTVAEFADVWNRLAAYYKDETAIWAYGIMNEPNATGGTWPAIAQAAIDSIRKDDLVHHILLAGDSWSNATGWTSKNPTITTVNDPAGRLIYEAHCYFDAGLDGYYGSYDSELGSPTLGVEKVKEFVEWLEARGARGFLGEYAVPRDDSRWLTTLNNYMAYIQAHGLSGTYWAGGAWWPSDNLTNCEPTSNPTTDRPQMSVLDDYHGAP
jgi:endoglucanase